MSLINSDIDICNIALSHMGIAGITSFTDNTEISKTCSKFYEIARYNLLRECKFQFSVKRANIPSLDESPAFEYTYQAQLPLDFISLLYLAKDNRKYLNNKKYFEIEGNKILANIKPPYNIVYISNIANPTDFNDEFKLLLSYYIAYLTAPKLGCSNDKTQYVYNEYTRLLTIAKHHNIIDNPPIKIYNSTYVSLFKNI